MDYEPQITFRNLDSSPSVKDLILERIADLEQVFEEIVSCKVAVEGVGNRHRHGSLFHVGVHLSVPGREIIVSRDHEKNHAHEDIRVAVRDAFDAARRQLEDYVHRLKGQIKIHRGPVAEIA